MMASGKPIFAPVPARALGDDRLRGLHWKTLAAIALHDRLGKNRQGCWAGNKRLAQIIGCDYSRLSATITDLATWGYIERRPHPLNKRLRVLLIIYSNEDAAVLKRNGPDDSLRTGKQSGGDDADDGLRDGKEHAGTVCRDFQKTEDYQEVDPVEYIPLKRGRDFPEGMGINSGEPASPDGAAMPGSEDGTASHRNGEAAYLAQAERWLKELSGRELSVAEVRDLREVRHQCEAIEAEAATDDKLLFWARRLASDIGWRLEEARR